MNHISWEVEEHKNRLMEQCYASGIHVMHGKKQEWVHIANALNAGHFRQYLPVSGAGFEKQYGLILKAAKEKFGFNSSTKNLSGLPPLEELPQFEQIAFKILNEKKAKAEKRDELKESKQKRQATHLLHENRVVK